MVGNISKQKRDDLIMKIGHIRRFVSAAPQDENTKSQYPATLKSLIISERLEV